MTKRTCAGTKQDGKPCRSQSVHGEDYCIRHLRQRPRTPKEEAQLAAVQVTLARLETELCSRFPDWIGRRYLKILEKGAQDSPEVAKMLADPAGLPDDALAAWAAAVAAWIQQRAKIPAAGGEPETPSPGELLAAIITELPQTLAQITTEEVRVLIEGISHGRTGEGWQRAMDGASRVFRPRPNGHEVRLRVYSAPDQWGPSELSRRLDETLAAWDLDAAFLALATIGALAEGAMMHAAGVASGNLAPVADLGTDDLLRGLGKDIRTRDQRNEWRRWIRRRLIEISGAAVVGARKGRYRAAGSREEVDTYREEALFHVIDAETTWEGSQLPLDVNSGNPLRLRIHGGGLFREIARNPSMLQRIGDLRILAEINGGRTPGQWARAMGLAYAQLVREQIHKPAPRKKFTRRELLSRFPPTPTASEILEGPHPKRAVDYWGLAKKDLIALKWWAEFPEPPTPKARYGWGEEWLDQEIAPEMGEALRRSVIVLEERAALPSPATRKGKR